MKSLYRRWRPLKLADVVGQEQVTAPLINALKDNKISHAYLFTGPRGTGKTSVARIFAHEVNKFSYELEDDYTDIIEIDGASNRGVDNIREIREKAAIAPTQGRYKVYIIDEVHMLTKEAFNALLKTLEEPPEHVIFIMATTDAYKVPVTIVSRAQTYTFKLADKDVIFKHLTKICEKENINITPDALEIIVKRGGGSFRDSLSLLDQISTISESEITKDMVEKIMGLPEDEKITEILNGFISRDVVKITTLLKELYDSGVKAEIIAEEMIAKIVDEPQGETLKLLEKLTEIREPFAEARLLCTLASGVSLLGADCSNRDVIRGDADRTAPTGRTCPVRPEYTSRLSQSGEAPSKGTPDSAPGSNNLERFTQKKDVGAEQSFSEFSWEDFLNKVKVANDAVFLQLKDARWRISGQKLIIEPAKSFAKVILNKPNNLKILNDAAGKEVMIGDASGESQLENEKSENLGAKSEINSKISAIMGGEVEEYGGGSPF